MQLMHYFLTFDAPMLNSLRHLAKILASPQGTQQKTGLQGVLRHLCEVMLTVILFLFFSPSFYLSSS